MPVRQAVQPLSLRIARHNETTGAAVFIVVAPQVLPVAALFQVVLIEFLLAQSLGHQCNGIVAVAVLHRPVAGAVNAPGHISQLQVLAQSATTFGLVAAARVYGGILQHGLQGFLVVNAFQPLH